MVKVTVETVTPQMARQYLSKSRGNRRVRPRAIDMLARDITNGNFYTTNQGIGFNEEGTLVDGHHRLLAIIKAGVPATMQVTRGMSRSATFAIDRGETRSVRDVIDLSGEVKSEDNKSILDRRIVSAINQLVKFGYKSVKLSASETLGLFNNFKRWINPLYSLIFSKGQCSGNTAPVVAAAIAAALCGTDMTAIERFFGVMNRDDLSGCDCYNTQAALNWRRQLLEAKAHGVRIEKRKLYLGTQNALWHFANSTNVSRVTVPSKPRYEVGAMISELVSI